MNCLRFIDDVLGYYPCPSKETPARPCPAFIAGVADDCPFTPCTCKETPTMAVNPKEIRAVADGKAPLDYLEPALNVPLAHVMKHGADKYGYRNYTVTPCKLRTYIGAIQRHLDAIKFGEDIDPDSGQPHLAHIAACCAVVLGCRSAGMLVDDRAAHATTLSDRVHKDGDLQAKAAPAPFVVDAMCGYEMDSYGGGGHAQINEQCPCIDGYAQGACKGPLFPPLAGHPYEDN